jgi:hypothetical protein
VSMKLCVGCGQFEVKSARPLLSGEAMMNQG